MKLHRIRRLAFLRRGDDLLIHRPGATVLRDYSEDFGLINGDSMFHGLEIGKVALVETFAFPHVGEVIRFDDVSITLKGSVRILYDGRATEFAAGKPPATAEIEKNIPVYTISADFVAAWGIYPGGKIPKPQ